MGDPWETPAGPPMFDDETVKRMAKHLALPEVQAAIAKRAEEIRAELESKRKRHKRGYRCCPGGCCFCRRY